jgi:hypothetical protein
LYPTDTFWQEKNPEVDATSGKILLTLFLQTLRSPNRRR